MYWMIDKAPQVLPDLAGEGMQLPDWIDREGFAFKWRGSAGLKMTDNGCLAVLDKPTGREMFRVTRKAVLDFAKKGSRIYRYSDWIGPLLVEIDGHLGLKLCLPRDVFFEHRERALILMGNYDKECARIIEFKGAQND